LKLVIATGFTGGMAFAPFLHSLEQTRRTLDQAGIANEFCSLASAAYVDDMRNWHVARFLEGNGTHLLFLDYDMEWDAAGLERLLTADVPICAGTYRVKNAWMRWTASVMEADGVPMGMPRKDGRGFLLECDNLAMGFTLIRRDVFERMRESMKDSWYHTDGVMAWDWFTRIREGREHYGEDYSFCRRWRALGGQLFIDPDITLNHYGMHGWRGNYHEFLLERKKVAQEIAA
jgi:hypothetical protein